MVTSFLPQKSAALITQDYHNIQTWALLKRIEMLSNVPSGNLATQTKPFIVNSTKENMMLILETDGGNNDRGFLATWSPMTHYDHIEG